MLAKGGGAGAVRPRRPSNLVSHLRPHDGAEEDMKRRQQILNVTHIKHGNNPIVGQSTRNITHVRGTRTRRPRPWPGDNRTSNLAGKRVMRNPVNGDIAKDLGFAPAINSRVMASKNSRSSEVTSALGLTRHGSGIRARRGVLPASMSG